MFNCKYSERYLKCNESRGIGYGVTPSSYIGTFYRYGNVHQTKKLISDMEKNSDKIFAFRSVKGGKAYYPLSMLQDKSNEKYKILVAMKKLNPEMDVNKHIPKRRLQ